MLTRGSAQCSGSTPTTDVALNYVAKPETWASAVSYVWLATVHHWGLSELNCWYLWTHTEGITSWNGINSCFSSPLILRCTNICPFSDSPLGPASPLLPPTWSLQPVLLSTCTRPVLYCSVFFRDVFFLQCLLPWYLVMIPCASVS